MEKGFITKSFVKELYDHALNTSIIIALLIKDIIHRCNLSIESIESYAIENKSGTKPDLNRIAYSTVEKAVMLALILKHLDTKKILKNIDMYTLTKLVMTMRIDVDDRSLALVLQKLYRIVVEEGNVIPLHRVTDVVKDIAENMSSINAITVRKLMRSIDVVITKTMERVRMIEAVKFTKFSDRALQIYTETVTKYSSSQTEKGYDIYNMIGSLHYEDHLSEVLNYVNSFSIELRVASLDRETTSINAEHVFRTSSRALDSVSMLLIVVPPIAILLLMFRTFRFGIRVPKGIWKEYESKELKLHGFNHDFAYKFWLLLHYLCRRLRVEMRGSDTHREIVTRVSSLIRSEVLRKFLYKAMHSYEVYRFGPPTMRKVEPEVERDLDAWLRDLRS